MRAGLVTATFRQLTPVQILELCKENHLEAIEWSGDIHVPPNNMANAVEIGNLTRANGMDIVAYGSYYRLGMSEAAGLSFASVLETAKALGTSAIRVWAGNQGSLAATPQWRQTVIDDAWRCADLAAKEDIHICYEFHDNTLTDTIESTCSLLAATDHPFISMLWQPPHGRSLEECLAGLRLLIPRLHHVHCFHWWPTLAERHPLRDGKERWAAYVAELSAQGCNVDFLLEFVVANDPLAIKDDAVVLQELLSQS